MAKFHIIREYESGVYRDVVDTTVIEAPSREAAFDALIGMADEDAEDDIRKGRPIKDVTVYNAAVMYAVEYPAHYGSFDERRTYQMFEF